MSNLVDSWLNGIGLGYAVPIFAGQGINSPDMLSELDVVDFPELGISDQNDRKKLFYLIQRVKLALARGRGAAENKAAPQADSAVSSTGAAKEEAASREPAPRAKEEGGSSSAAGGSSVRFRRELEVPAARAAGSPRAGSARNKKFASAGGSGGSGGGGGGGGDAGAVGRLTPAKAQRLPPSHRRPKTPHADGTVRARQQPQKPPPQQQQQPPQSPADTRTSSSSSTGRGSRARQQQQQPPVGRLAAAAAESGVAVLAVEHETSVHVFPGEHRDGSGGGCGVPGGGAERPPSSRSNTSNKPCERHRSVLEPVQLDEAGGHTRLLSSSSSSCSSTAADEGRSMPPPPSTRSSHPAPGIRAGRADPSAVIARPPSRGKGTEAPEMLGKHAVAVETTVPPRPPRDAQERLPQGGVVVSSRPPPEGVRDASPRHSSAAPPANAAIAPSHATQEVAHLKRDTAGTAGSSSSGGGGTAQRMETPAGGGESSAGTLPAAGREGERPTAVPPAFPSPPEVEGGRLGEGDDRDDEAAAGVGPAAPAEKRRRESAAELAVHLISAHREDVRSALAAARRDMDLVSKADKDRQPAALMEYAREVEGVLGQRIAAGTKLRQALDSYLALRKAVGGAAASTSTPPPKGHGLQGGRLRAEGRALRT